MSAVELRRSLGLPSVVATSTGLAFAAVEYLAAASLVVSVSGDSGWISVLVAGLLTLVAWACFGELNGLYPSAAAIRRYMSRAMPDSVGLTITLTYMATIVVVIAADAFIVGSALAYALGEPPIGAAIWIAALLGLAVVCNLRGATVASAVEIVVTAIVVVGTIIVSTAATVHVHRGFTTPFQPFARHGVTGFLQSVALGVFLFSAFEWVTTNAEEVRRPANIHRGMGIALATLGVVAAGITVAMSHALDAHQRASAYPQLFLGQVAFGHAGLLAMTGITALTAVNTFNGGFITASRFCYGTAREGALSPVFTKLNDRAVPWVPVVGLGVVAGLAALIVAWTGSWADLVAVGAALEAMIYAVACYCTLVLRRRDPEAHRPFRVVAVEVVAGAGLIVFTVLALAAALSVNGHASVIPLLLLIGGAAVAAVEVVLLAPRRRAAAAARMPAPRRRPPRPPTSPAS